MVWLMWIREIRFEFGSLGARTDSGQNQMFSELLLYQYERETVGITALLILPGEAEPSDPEHQPGSGSETPWEIRQSGVLELPLLGTRTLISFAGQMRLDPNFNLVAFDYALSLPTGAFGTSGAVTEEGTLNVSYGVPGNFREMSFPVPSSGVSMYLAATPLLAHRIPFKSGTRHRIEQFNPLTAAMEEVRITFGQETEVLHREVIVPVITMELDVSGMKSVALVTSDGRTMKESSPLGLTVSQLEQSEGLFMMARRGASQSVLSLLPFGRVTLNRPVKTLTVRLSDIILVNFALETSRQTWLDREADLLTVNSPQSPDELPELVAPLSGEQMMGIASSVRELAGDIVSVSDAVNDPVQATRMLCDWIDEYIEERPFLATPSPLDVLRTRTSNADGRNHLFVEMARAVGIPYRVVSGLVYDRGAFFLREWARLDSNGSQIEVDAAVSPVFVDASYIQLWDAPLHSVDRLAWHVTNLKIEVIEQPDAAITDKETQEAASKEATSGT